MQREASFAAEKQTIWRIYGFKKKLQSSCSFDFDDDGRLARDGASFAGAPADLTDALVAAQGYYYE